MVCVVLNLSTEEDSDNLGKKGGGKRYYDATPIWVSGESREDQALPRQWKGGKDLTGGGFEGREKLKVGGGGRGTMTLVTQSELTVRVEKIKLYLVNGREERMMVLFSLKHYTKAN